MSDSVTDEVLHAVGTSRRQVLAKAGMVGAAAIAAGMFGTGKRGEAKAALSTRFGGAKGMKYEVTDDDILNFALNLEYLEAEFYNRANSGVGLADVPNEDLVSGVGGAGGTVIGNTKVAFTEPTVAQYASEIALDELNHVRLLRSVLGKKAVAEPDIDLVNSFTYALTAAGLIDSVGALTPDEVFLLQSFTFEDVGVTAYHGAAPYINHSAYLAAAAGILAVEAYHAGEIRTVLYAMGQTSGSLLIPAANAISALRAGASAAVDSANPADQGITTSNGSANIIPTDSNSLAFSRTFEEVLNVVYLGGSAGKYGFFPNKTNGVIS